MDVAFFEGEIREDNKIVSAWLLYYHERREEYLSLREEIICSSSPGLAEVMPGRKNMTGDPTGRKGQRLADLQETERWLALVEEVERRLPWKMKVFLKLRREYRHARGRQGWTSAVQWRFSQEVAAGLGKKPEDAWVESRNTFTRWWDRIVEYAARLAAKNGLLC